MNRSATISMRVSATVAFAILLAPAFTDAAEPTNAVQQLASMEWLAGSWVGRVGDGAFHAHYSTPEGGRIISHCKRSEDGRTRFYEFEVFEVRRGRVVFSPYPGGRGTAPLSLTECEAGRAVFENPIKDFPTRISYRRVSEDRLVITLSDPHGKTGADQVFDLQRCSRYHGEMIEDLSTLRAACAAFEVDHGRSPTQLSELVDTKRPAGGENPDGTRPYLESVPRDPWGREYQLVRLDHQLRISSLGADGAVGGSGEDADVWWP